MEIITNGLVLLAAFGFKESFKKADEILKDQLSLWQFKNKVRVAEKAREFCQNKGLDPKILPKSFSMNLFDAVKNEENDKLQNMWAALLGNASIGNAVHPCYINIMKDLTTIEANILNKFYNTFKQTGTRTISKTDYEIMINNELSSNNPDLSLKKSVIIVNLYRLSLIDLVRNSASSDSNNAQFSNFAVDFVETCTWENESV